MGREAAVSERGDRRRNRYPKICSWDAAEYAADCHIRGALSVIIDCLCYMILQIFHWLNIYHGYVSGALSMVFLSYLETLFSHAVKEEKRKRGNTNENKNEKAAVLSFYTLPVSHGHSHCRAGGRGEWP